MKVALAQIDCVPGDVPANLRTITEQTVEAAAQGCKAVWFPELADTGYALSVMGDVAGAWPGPAYDAVAGAARQHGITVGIGLSERDGDRVYNSLAVFGPDGALAARYRKLHLFAAGNTDETACFVPGQALQCLDLGGLRHGLSVCYDLRFPEVYRGLADDGAEVLVNATAWPAARPHHWDHLTRARAIENQAWFLGVARVGVDEGIALNGSSRVVSPMGEVVAEAGSEQPALLVAEIDAAPVRAFRATIPALGARRPDVFG